MASDRKENARAELRRAEQEFERKRDEARTFRAASFRRAQQAGLSLREIADEVDLHYTRVGEIVRGD